MSNTSNDWKIKLANAILSGDKTVETELTVSEMPDKLYRYRPLKCDKSLDRVVDTLRNGKLWCSSSSELNDPFEFRSTLDFLHNLNNVIMSI